MEQYRNVRTVYGTLPNGHRASTDNVQLEDPISQAVDQNPSGALFYHLL